MNLSQRIAVAVLCASLLLAGACGGDDYGTRPVPTSTATATSASPGPEPTTVPLTPVLPAKVKALGSGKQTFQLGPGQTVELDTIALARDAGIDPPACAGFVLALAWSADGPGAANLRIETGIQGTFAEVGGGPGGDATAGCALLRFGASDTAFVDIAFAVGSLE